MKTLYLSLAAPKAISVPIIIGPGALQQAKAAIQQIDPDNVCILYDRKLEKLVSHLSDTIPKTTTIAIVSEESSKSLQKVEDIVKQMLHMGMTRNSLILTVGGGVITDLGSFVASVYMRGIKFIQIPTSLLCMVDAGLGGKTGIDIDTKKNIVGTFRHPEMIFIDTTVLETLPDLQLREGLVEVIKMAACLHADTFEWLEDNVKHILRRDEEILQECIERAIQIKIDVVIDDEHETNRRKLLNFGHTIGHALEANSKFTLSHGQAISRGIVAEMVAMESAACKRVENLLKKIDMPTDIPSKEESDVLWALMQNDKKVTKGKVMMAVPTNIGSAEMIELTADIWKQLTS